MKKLAIISLNTRISVAEQNIRSIESVYLQKWFEGQGYDTYWVSKKTRKEKDVEKYLDYRTTNLNDFDVVVCHNCTRNFIGGGVGGFTVNLIKQISDYHGKLYWAYTDPNLYLANMAYEIRDADVRGLNRKYETDERISEYDANMFARKEWHILWCGKNYPEYWQSIQNKRNIIEVPLEKVEYFPFFEYVFANKETNSLGLPLIEREFDLCYYGNFRGSRKEQYNKFLKNDLKKLICGFQEKHMSLPNAEYLKYVDHADLYKEVGRAWCSIVIGDPAHNNNIVTARFFENIKFGVVNFIDLEYDPDKELIQNDKLKKLLYVENGEDLASKITYLKKYPEKVETILNWQLQELERYANLNKTYEPAF